MAESTEALLAFVPKSMPATPAESVSVLEPTVAAPVCEICPVAVRVIEVAAVGDAVNIGVVMLLLSSIEAPATFVVFSITLVALSWPVKLIARGKLSGAVSVKLKVVPLLGPTKVTRLLSVKNTMPPVLAVMLFAAVRMLAAAVPKLPVPVEFKTNESAVIRLPVFEVIVLLPAVFMVTVPV